MRPRVRSPASPDFYPIENCVLVSVAHDFFLYWQMLQWRNRLAHGTYRQYMNEKCQGCEFEPHLEQAYIFSLLLISQVSYSTLTKSQCGHSARLA